METALTGGIDELLKEGIPGLVILALGFVSWRLFKLYTDTQEKRIAESTEAVKAMTAMTTAVEGLADLIKDRRTPL